MDDARTPDDPTEAAPAASDGGDVTARLWRLSAAFAIAAMAGTVLVLALHSFRLDRLYDDAYIFQRYAHRLMAGDGMRWNPGGEPTYGLTSPLFLLVVAPFQKLVSSVGLAGLLTSYACGLAFWVLAVRLVRAVAPRSGVRIATALIVLFCMGRGHMPDHFISGMETTFALAYLTGYLTLLWRFARKPTAKRALLVGVVGGLAFGVRPELVATTLLGVGLPALFADDAALRRLARRALGVTIAVLAAHLVFNQVYLRSALPLTFYVKSTAHYAVTIYKRYRGVSTQRMVEFVRDHWPLMLLAVHRVAGLRRGGFRKPEGLVDLAAFGGAAVLIGYHWLIALPVMAYSQRFNFPALPALIYLSARSLSEIGDAVAAPLERVDARVRHLVLSAFVAVMVMMVLPKGVKYGIGVVKQLAEDRYFFTMQRYLDTPAAGQWVALKHINKMPNDLVLAATEVGLPGGLNPDKVLVDMAGLNERRYAHQRFDADHFFRTYAPDVIYMPHGDYANMNRALRRSPHIRGYDLFEVRDLPKGALALALRRDSKHYVALRRVVHPLVKYKKKKKKKKGKKKKKR